MTSDTMLTLSEAAVALRTGETTSVGLVQNAIAVADAHDDAVGMFIDRYTDRALAAATAADADLAAGRLVGPLHGLPLGIKDIITTADGPTTAQSLVHDPSSFTGDAVVVQRLKQAGGIIMGKLTTMEFAIGAPDETKPFPVPRNAWSLDHWAGGSSSGSGSSVALGAVLGALGTDTGGSIRIPAAFNGITGLMPTYGRVPKSGCVPLGFTLDHIGPMARSAEDCALMLDVLAGPDSSDPTTLDVPVADYSGALTGDLTGLKIGVDKLARVAGDDADPALDQAWNAALEVLAGRGAEIVGMEIPYYQAMATADFVNMLGEALAYHLPDLQAKWSDYGAATRLILAQGAFYSAADYVQAARARRVGVRAITDLFSTVDVIATPTASTGATSFADLDSRGVVRAMSAIHTGYWDSTGNPVLTVPFGFTGPGLPLGLQFAGRPFDEATLLRIGDAFQSVTDFHLQAPALLDQELAA
ncbi:aspartyl-tRNA(Asn)/glutamyl-tRNA(Gln) amidotransferase subunit A [Kribbella aluminosa]|uniref:Aspartyl-tRNA(Asn)/glutamyl-tRNA(Gln) amidotransferase subunit A n=1 Tax=Kribbella aluminosa TaxID=416017 RepID=A0ABS4UN37_9ACTN|nr:amidase [Kribbella aluminosa]MBP2353020.1 aspartyl-tRNA(Asn)/glutamyl-tRNA(Gln) amidotransferase subunit A [Kribbella aluminosa]